uniref:EF-hand domain-containing protein n=1 Tax=Romanomermis culicivorax TaxID=13658 RepID=A0A915KZB0_ROMCU
MTSSGAGLPDEIDLFPSRMKYESAFSLTFLAIEVDFAERKNFYQKNVGALADEQYVYSWCFNVEQDEEIQLTFKVMDKDGDGLITMTEFRDFLVKIEAIQDPVKDEKIVKTMFEMFDKNCDGRLSFE